MPKKEPQLHPIFQWLRTTEIGAELFGWGGLVLTDWFWPATILIYLGFVLVGADLWVGPELRAHPRWRWAGMAIITAFAVMFSKAFVFYPAPLNISSFWNAGSYPNGTVSDGITWRPEFSELTVTLDNPTTSAYEDLNVVIQPTDPVVAIAQVSPLPDVTLEDKNALSLRLLDVNPTGTQTIVPLVLIATDAGYRIRCGRLPPKGHLKVAIALADIRWNPPAIPLDTAEAVKSHNYVLRQKNFDDFSSYWWGYPDGDVYVRNPSPPQWFKTDGQYRVRYRTKYILEEVKITKPDIPIGH